MGWGRQNRLFRLPDSASAATDLELINHLKAMPDARIRRGAWLQRLAERPSWLWNAGIGLIIGLSLLRWLLQR